VQDSRAARAELAPLVFSALRQELMAFSLGTSRPMVSKVASMITLGIVSSGFRIDSQIRIPIFEFDLKSEIRD